MPGNFSANGRSEAALEDFITDERNIAAVKFFEYYRV